MLIKNQPTVLITDHRAFLGLERQCVVTIVDQDDDKMLHRFTEIVSRCSTSLYVIVIGDSGKVFPGTLGVVFQEWRKKNLAQFFDGCLYESINSSKDVDVGEDLFLVNTSNKVVKDMMKKCSTYETYFSEFDSKYPAIFTEEMRKLVVCGDSVLTNVLNRWSIS